MNIAKEWNIIDMLIMKTEHFVHNFKLEDLSDQVDVEAMIVAETEHLREENEHLREREIPVYMIRDAERYICPKCHIFLPEDVRYCSNCGHRVMKHISINGHRTKDE